MTIQQTQLRRPLRSGEGISLASRFATIFLVLALTYTASHLLFGKSNVVRVHAMQKDLGLKLTKNEAARKRNEKLAAEVQELSEGLIGVEEHARESLGMVKPNEIFVSIIPDTPPTK